MSDKLDFKEPTGEIAAGYQVYTVPRSPYERFMEEEGIPIHRGIGVYDVRELPLGNWDRLGGRGSFLYLDGLEDAKGMFVVEVPAGGALNPEKHVFDEFFLVIEGRGTTEVWREGGRPQVFEWQPGSLFMAPINAHHRLVNATNSPALLLASNNAPPIMNVFQSRRFIFENPYEFTERYGLGDDFFRARTDLEAEPVRGRAAIRSNVFPDVVRSQLPLDNQRAPGYRRIQPYFEGFLSEATTGGFLSEYPSGRYSKGHYHKSGAVLVCLKGQGYTFTWPVELGPRPWESGHADQVKTQEYKAGGLVAAAPGGGNWFHQHFSSGAEPMRVLNYWGGPTGEWGGLSEEKGGDEVKAGNLFSVSEGGRTIMYPEEDPFIQQEFARRLAHVGVSVDMPARFYAAQGRVSASEHAHAH